MKEVLQEDRTLRNHSTILQGLLAYDPQANGAAEKAVQECMGQLRNIKIGLEARLKCKIESEWANLLQWINDLAPELKNRCQIGRGGRTAYNRL